MKTIGKIGLLLVASVIVEDVFSQIEPSWQQTNSAWQKRDRSEMRPLEWESVREADVMWSKNIWRMIDTRQKMNLPFSYPQEPLVQIIHEAAKRGEIDVYDASVVNADQCVKKLEVEMVRRTGTRNDTSMAYNILNPDIEEQQIVHEELAWNRITKYKIREVWYFDTHLSAMKVRILSIAPVMEDYDATGNYRGDMTMYWVPYARLRELLAKHEVHNSKNDSQQMSWEDLFEARMFESYIYKESNVHDRNIQEYASGVDAQLESERIKQEIFEKEHDVWEY